MNYLFFLSSIIVEIRDFFEPGGSKKSAQILTSLVAKVRHTPTLDSKLQVDFEIMTALVNLCRIVGKSEANKSKSTIFLPFILSLREFKTCFSFQLL
jgi:hypothetical protein